jgi:SAM-dependent methyltransferase
LGQHSYILDVGYTAGFYAETAPHWMAFCASAAGHVPGAPPKRVFELGTGQGFGLALLAAANPGMQFDGCDFNPDHVAQAQRFITDADLRNISVCRMSFGEAARQTAAKDIDVALAHGILSWVAPDVQGDIVAWLKHRLCDDGLLYVSYNCAVGWAAIAPLRHLIIESKRHVAGGSQAQLAKALDWMQQLRRTNAPLFAANPAIAVHFDAMLARDPSYLAHEYLADAAAPLNFSQAAALLEGAGLGYAASANPIENFDALGMPAAALPLLAETSDAVMRETLRDFAVNRFFRRDLFSRNCRGSTQDEQRKALAGFRFILSVPRSRLRLDFHGPAGPVTGAADVYEPLADLLVDGADWQALAELPAFASAPPDRLLNCLVLLIDSRQVHAMPISHRIDVEPARRFNRMVIDAARRGVVYGHLACPVTGTGIAVSDFDLLALAAIADGTALDPQTLAERCFAIIAALGRRPLRDGAPIADHAEAIAFLVPSMQYIVEQNLPLWRRLRIG